MKLSAGMMAVRGFRVNWSGWANLPPVNRVLQMFSLSMGTWRGNSCSKTPVSFCCVQSGANSCYCSEASGQVFPADIEITVHGGGASVY